MDDARKLYDVLDRLVHMTVESDGLPPHRYSPLGSALHQLHELKQYAGERCICAETFSDPAE